MKTITTATKLYILLGYPLGHTISPPMHNLAFHDLSMDCCYFPVEVSPENLGTVFQGLSKMNLGGMNVTIPHKIRIMEHLDELDPVAATIGAVNTIRFIDGRSKGYNTDGEGFIQSLEEEAAISVKEKCFYIIGCGGAARAISMTLAFRGAEKIFISNRTEEKAVQLAEEINTKIDLVQKLYVTGKQTRKVVLKRAMCSSTAPVLACTHTFMTCPLTSHS